MNDYPPLITDDEVARLPVHAGRADLLEEIMTTNPALDRIETRRARRRPAPGWFAVAGAAAAVAAIALVPAARGAFHGASHPAAPYAGSPSSAPSDSPSSSPAAEPGMRSVPGGDYVALDAPGWQIGYAYEGHGTIDVSYTSGKSGDRLVELVQYPASQYGSYYADRQDVGDPAPDTVLGKKSSTFTYSAQDHATIRPAEGGHFLEVRGTGMNLAAYRDLLAHLVQTDQQGFADSMPPDVVTPYNQKQAVAHLLEGVTVPDGFTAADVDIKGFNDAYQSTAKVAGSVGCAWLDVYAGGGPAARQRALAAFDGSAEWPLLTAIRDQGGYSSVFWGIAEQLRAGAPPAQLRASIC